MPDSHFSDVGIAAAAFAIGVGSVPLFLLCFGSHRASRWSYARRAGCVSDGLRVAKHNIIDKQDPGRARHSSLATAEANFAIKFMAQYFVTTLQGSAKSLKGGPQVE